MSEKRAYRMDVREFLNRPGHHAGAYAIMQVSNVDDSANKYGRAVCTLADCTDVINFAFPLGDEQIENSVEKAHLLATLFADFATALTLEATALRKRRRELAARKAAGGTLSQDEEWEIDD